MLPVIHRPDLTNASRNSSLSFVYITNTWGQLKPLSFYLSPVRFLSMKNTLNDPNGTQLFLMLMAKNRLAFLLVWQTFIA